MAEVMLTKGYIALVDDADLPFVAQWLWHVQDRQGLRYARRNVEVAGKTSSIYMHRVLMDPPDGMVVDHINRNGLDNRRSNLRLVSQAENLWNSRNVDAGAPRWSPQTQKWRATISYQNRKYEVGKWADRAKAIAARDFVAAVLRGKEPEPFDILELPPTIRKLVISRLPSQPVHGRFA